jgi:hypothetical protein
MHRVLTASITTAPARLQHSHQRIGDLAGHPLLDLCGRA